MLRIGLRFGGPRALGLAIHATQGNVGPECAAGHDRKLRPWELAAQTLPDMPHDDRNVTDQVAELVDPVEEHRDAILVQSAQYAEQGDIGGRQGLLWCKYHDVDMRALERAPGDLVANQIGVVGPRCVYDRGRETELALAEIEIGGLDDVGVDAFFSARVVGEARADVALEVLGREQ